MKKAMPAIVMSVFLSAVYPDSISLAQTNQDAPPPVNPAGKPMIPASPAKNNPRQEKYVPSSPIFSRVR
ncbi:MAG: hypothetical protein HY796_12645 [Elusimicrobia bacterium]|nr:hypothetical protein [Elusimicrobiota bacterium]